MWMTSASELFHSRRYRFGLRHNAIDVSGFDSSLPETNSSFSHQHRTSNRRHSHHYAGQNNRREHRHDFDVCDPAPRRIHRRRLDHSEHEAVVQHEQGHSLSPSSSIINSDDFRSIQRRRATANDRLPGAVLLARERLVERLRGVSVSGNRQSSGGSSSSHQDRFTESETNLLEEVRRRKHPGEDGLKWLEMEVFGFKNDDERSNSRSRECTICLEGFEDGDRVIELNCAHIFHWSCLFPWVRVCGACPNCRKPIAFGFPDFYLPAKNKLNRRKKEIGKRMNMKRTMINLHTLFGKNLERATRIVDQKGVKRISGETSGRFIFQIIGESRRKEEYLCFPEHYCGCYSFFYDIVNRGEHLYCKHQLAARLAVSLGTCDDVKVSDEQLAQLLAKL
ncbi:hypothetical protein OSB04_006286 [Centaurea solstitialis]|uniref:RING-type domain-containing protein n=1 Tax=Centaurea solstitialis TaxID=347529 RepID=A0AA38WSK7_9ASTR|nr:hypothetical protein OSB04_006286 [Centaurea solstitialis]